MREIKFKYYFLLNKVVVNTKIFIMEDIEDINFNTILFLNVDCNKDNFENMELYRSEYTGLKDKNGVEIYEGDIIKAIWSKDCEEYIANEIWIGDIFFNCGSFDINSEWCVALNCFNGALEVIGNIYENKEL